MATLSERIRAAVSDSAWAALRADWGEARWEKLAAKRASIQAACDKAAAAADATPRATRVLQLPGLTGVERELVENRMSSHADLVGEA